MKKNFLRFVSLAVVLLMVIGCVGCGKKADNESTAGQEEDIYDGLMAEYDGDAGTQSTAEDAGGESGEKDNNTSEGKTSAVENDDIFKNIPKSLKGTTVKVAHWGDEGGEKYQELAKAFTRATNINVKWQLYNQLSYESDILKQIAAGNGPDVIIINDHLPQTYEIAQPLPSIFNIHDGFWNPNISEHTKLNGKYYFVNSYNSPYIVGSIVVYNKRIFSQNGIKSPLAYYEEGKGNWSYEDLKKCMLEVKAKGFYGGIIDPTNLAAQMGGSMFNYDAKTGKVSGSATDAKLLEAVRYYAECREENLCGNYFIANYPSGNIAIALTDPYAIKYNGYLKDMSPSDYGAVMPPNSYKGQKLEYRSGSIRGYGIAKNAANPEGGYYFLRYFLDLDKYTENGIQIFGNKEMQKFYTQTFLKVYSTEKVYYRNLQGSLNLVSSDWLHSKVWQEARNVAPGQVAVSMAKNKNIVDNAVNEANKKLASIK